ncbi:sulfotransferase domain-containing protein [Sphingomonas arenae]|uniref:sulfotransferase domain-containing protein n=1 Tax=Sphingomonas arenae TaxID=2812555 RepID=UPI001F2D48D0|nr:sulfotransferase domain-containing protein [Sphingomonas arenae]
MELAITRPRIKALAKGVKRRWRDEPRLRAAAAQADAFLISFPKSGRTWLRFLLSSYYAEAAGLGFQPDLTTTFRVLPNFDFDPVRGLGASVETAGGGRYPRVLVSHLPFSERIFLDRPIAFLVRDPRDVLVSAYFHATRHKHVFAGGIDEFLEDRTYGIQALCRFLNGWADALQERRHLVLSYEQLQASPELEVERLLRFLGTAPDPEVVRRAIAASRFDRMRTLERVGGIPGHDYDRQDDASLRMRNGEARSFGKWLNADQAARVLERCRADLSSEAWALLGATGIH